MGAPGNTHVRPASEADAAALARCHALNFARPWTADDLAILIDDPHISGWRADMNGDIGGFVLIRSAAGEAEILTLCVDPAVRRQGLAENLLREALAETARRGGEAIFLEVAATNLAARRLYAKFAFKEVGLRKGYYGGEGADAIVLRRTVDAGT